MPSRAQCMRSTEIAGDSRPEPSKDMSPKEAIWSQLNRNGPRIASRSAAVREWVASVHGRRLEMSEILQIKRWGVTARFEATVLKVAHTPMFPQVVGVHRVLDRIEPKAAPELIAETELDGQHLTLFEFLPGVTAEERGTVAALEASPASWPAYRPLHRSSISPTYPSPGGTDGGLAARRRPVRPAR